MNPMKALFPILLLKSEDAIAAACIEEAIAENLEMRSQLIYMISRDCNLSIWTVNNLDSRVNWVCPPSF
jgi:hypothetical protein